jgi:C1A family cysteine protease
VAVELTKVQAQVAALGLDWQPGETVNSNLSLLRTRSRTGAVPPEGQRSLQERAMAAAAAPHESALAAATGLPSKIDWRNKSGNWVTAIRDQQYCGSCVAFGTVAVLESMIKITAKAPKLPVDLSEAHLFFCYGPDTGAGRCPGGGWWPDDSFGCLKKGVVDDACFPYTDEDQTCHLGADAKDRLTTASAFTVLTTPTQMKRHLATVGPLSACFTIYEDFASYYTGGVYRYHEKTSGEYVGGHCVCIIGYDDAQKCWIAKNSWGTAWGEQGFFRIGYGECGIDASMWGITGTVKSPFLASLQLIAVQAGEVRHIERPAGGSWPPEVDTLATPSSSAEFSAISCAGVAGGLQVVGLAGQGAHTNVWHTVRSSSSGTWQSSFGNVNDPGHPRTLSAVSCTAVGTDLHVVGIDGGTVVHTVRRSTGRWQGSFDTLAPPMGLGPVTAVACAGVGGTVHVVAVADGGLWHNVRDSTGKWQQDFDHVVTPAGTEFTAVACAGVYGALQVVGLAGIGANSNLWHSIRKPDGNWQGSFGNVKDPGLTRSFDAVSCTGVAGDLQLVALVDGQLWQTVRFASGKWQAGFVQLPGSGGGPFTAVGCAAVR